MNDMGRIDPMYQFSLDAYIELFSNSIDKSLKHPRLEERIQYLNDFHTFAVYQYTCRGLFERHKLLFSFQMCAKILEAAGKLNLDEYNFFLRGGVVSWIRVKTLKIQLKYLSSHAFTACVFVHIFKITKLLWVYEISDLILSLGFWACCSFSYIVVVKLLLMCVSIHRCWIGRLRWTIPANG